VELLARCRARQALPENRPPWFLSQGNFRRLQGLVRRHRDSGPPLTSLPHGRLGGISVDVLQKCAAFKELVVEIARVLDSQFIAQLPVQYHYRALARQATNPGERRPQAPIRMTYQDDILSISSPLLTRHYFFHFQGLVKILPRRIWKRRIFTRAVPNRHLLHSISHDLLFQKKGF